MNPLRAHAVLEAGPKLRLDADALTLANPFPERGFPVGAITPKSVRPNIFLGLERASPS
jgi:hypothetical protein